MNLWSISIVIFDVKLGLETSVDKPHSVKYTEKLSNIEIDPLMAAKVVKNYLLPMFKQQKKNSKISKKNIGGIINSGKIDGKTMKRIKQNLPDTVFGQLMLSDILYEKIQNMQMEDNEKTQV